MTLNVELRTADDAMRQACMTAHDYLMNAVNDIDKLMGKGYARAHSDLIAAYMRTAAQDFHTTLMKTAAQDTALSIEALSPPLFSTTIAQAIQDLADKVSNVAEMLDLYSCGRPVT